MTSSYVKVNNLKIIILVVLINSLICVKVLENVKTKGTALNNKNGLYSIQQTSSIIKLFESISTIFLSGLFDRSFFVTALLAIKYSKCLVIVAGSIALSTVGIISVFLGLTINKYIDMVWIDFFSIFLFLMFGIKMIVDGLQINKTDNLMNSEASNAMYLNDEERIVGIKPDTTKGDLHLNKKTSEIMNSTQIFVNIFLFVFASEIGDRSQISTIFLTTNFDKITVFLSVIIGQTLLTIIAVFGGIFIAQKVSTKNLTIIAGSTFILFGIVALFMLCSESNFVTGFNSKASTMNHMDDLKSFKLKYNIMGSTPEKEKPNFMK